MNLYEPNNLLLIRTPEGITFWQTLAGPVIRFLAWFVDLMAIAALMMLFGYITFFFRLVNADFASAVAAIGYFFISIGYGIAGEWLWRGQTLGKKLLRLRVIDAAGLQLQFNQVVIRNLLRFVDSLPFIYFVGGIACLLNCQTQRLGDLAANTVVAHLPRVTEPNLSQLIAGKYNSLRRYPHLIARLRQRTTPAEAALILQVLLRREEFEPAVRIALFKSIADHFRGKSEFPAEATDGVADEQYLRNLTEIFYRN